MLLMDVVGTAELRFRIMGKSVALRQGMFCHQATPNLGELTWRCLKSSSLRLSHYAGERENLMGLDR